MHNCIDKLRDKLYFLIMGTKALSRHSIFGYVLGQSPRYFYLG